MLRVKGLMGVAGGISVVVEVILGEEGVVED